MAPRIVGSGIVVVDAPGLKIEELAGNVASKEDRISIAYVKAQAGTKEPWLTLHYDEWICVRSGSICFRYGSEDEDVSEITAKAGETVFIPEGTRFNPQFPENVEYIPVCLPAFRPDRCIREDVEDAEGIAAKLKDLHGNTSTCSIGGAVSGIEEIPEVLYHMCPKKQWDDAKAKGEAYYPETYEQDGFYTHATGVPSRLIETANYFYTDSEGDWVCLEFTRTALRKVGIHVRDEEAMPVGEKKVAEEWLQKRWICPHVIGGLPTISGVVQKELPMTRTSGGKFVKIEGL